MYVRAKDYKDSVELEVSASSRVAWPVNTLSTVLQKNHIIITAMAT